MLLSRRSSAYLAVRIRPQTAACKSPVSAPQTEQRRKGGTEAERTLTHNRSTLHAAMLKDLAASALFPTEVRTLAAHSTRSAENSPVSTAEQGRGSKQRARVVEHCKATA